MSYNKARAEKEWLAWKKAEEKKLRKLGADEETIQRLRAYDWDAFLSERRYQQRWTDNKNIPFSSPEKEPVIKDIPSLLDSIEDAKLLHFLSQLDHVTLQILLLTAMGYNRKEIAERLHMEEHAVGMRLTRVRKKWKATL